MAQSKWWIFPLKMVIFHSYVSLPEGIHVETDPVHTSTVFSHRYSEQEYWIWFMLV